MLDYCGLWSRLQAREALGKTNQNPKLYGIEICLHHRSYLESSSQAASLPWNCNT